MAVLVNSPSLSANADSNAIGAVGTTLEPGQDIQGASLTVSGTFDAAATAGVTAYLYASPDGTLYDDANNPFLTCSVVVPTGGGYFQKTVSVAPEALAALASVGGKVHNNDTAKAVTNVVLTLEVRH